VCFELLDRTSWLKSRNKKALYAMKWKKMKNWNE
jgi:hypothetical protein